jgi:hypothetical protein
MLPVACCRFGTMNLPAAHGLLLIYVTAHLTSGDSLHNMVDS